MIETILSTLKVMGWLGVILAILATVNISTRTVYNTWHEKNSFSWKKMLRGIGKVALFYFSAVATGVAFTMLPFVNDLITNTFGVMLISSEALETMSTIGVLGVIIGAVISEGKSALQGIQYLLQTTTGDNEEVTWTVEEE